MLGMALHRILQDVSKPQVLVRGYSLGCSVSVQRTVVSGGLKIATAKRSGTPLVGCTVMFEAGSRYETGDDMGANHFLRRISDANTSSQTSFCKIRSLQQNGAYITCTSDRQYISYTLKCTEPVFHQHKDTFFDTAVNPGAFFWEIDPRREIIRNDIHMLSPQQRLFDLIQTAAWSHGLANSLYCPEERIDQMSECYLKEFIKKNFKSEKCSIGCVGLEYTDIVKIAEGLFPLPPPATPLDLPPLCPPPDLSYFRRGFELYDLGPGAESWFAIAVPSCGLDRFEDFLKYNIAAWACGTEPMFAGRLGYNQVAQSPLYELAGGDMYTTMTAFNIAYKEYGLFGIMGRTRACSLYHMCMQAAKFLKNITRLDACQIEVGKTRLQLSLERIDVNPVLKSDDFALQAANEVRLDSATDAAAFINAVTAPDMRYNLECIVQYSDHMAFAVVGDIGCIPTDAELRQTR